MLNVGLLALTALILEAGGAEPPESIGGGGGLGTVGLVGPAAENGTERRAIDHTRLRYRDECTQGQLLSNKEFMESKNMWDPSIVFWEQRAPPLEGCRHAQIVKNFAFTPQAKAFRDLMGPAIPQRFEHLSIAYFYDDKVLWSEMCGDDGQAFCDVPVDAPTGFEFFKWRLRSEWSSGYSRGMVPVTVCGRWLNMSEAEKLFDVVGKPYDCSMAWEAEQGAFSDFNWKKGWVPIDSDCLTLAHNIMDDYNKVADRNKQVGIVEHIETTHTVTADSSKLDNSVPANSLSPAQP